jgi:hypothetical protein
LGLPFEEGAAVKDYNPTPELLAHGNPPQLPKQAF